MEESREALAQKIELLEEKVTETVQTATASVAEATASVLETVQNATSSVSDTVDSVTSAVQGTVDTVRQSMEGTGDSVKEAFDLPRQVQEHPWWMMAGAIAAGYFGGRLLSDSAKASVAKSAPRREFNPNPQMFLAGRQDHRYLVPDEVAGNGFASNGAANRSSSVTTSPTWLHQLGTRFGPEIAKLESLAVGVALGTVRDFVVEAVPESIQQQISEVIDGLTEKLGGQCVRGKIAATPLGTHQGSCRV